MGPSKLIIMVPIAMLGADREQAARRTARMAEFDGMAPTNCNDAMDEMLRQMISSCGRLSGYMGQVLIQESNDQGPEPRQSRAERDPLIESDHWRNNRTMLLRESVALRA